MLSITAEEHSRVINVLSQHNVCVSCSKFVRKRNTENISEEIFGPGGLSVHSVHCAVWRGAQYACRCRGAPGASVHIRVRGGFVVRILLHLKLMDHEAGTSRLANGLSSSTRRQQR